MLSKKSVTDFFFVIVFGDELVLAHPKKIHLTLHRNHKSSETIKCLLTTENERDPYENYYRNTLRNSTRDNRKAIEEHLQNTIRKP